MGKYVFRRLVQAIPLLFLVSFALFLLMNALGDPLAYMMESRSRPSPEQRMIIMRRLGLDQPIMTQYLTWLIGNDWQIIDVRGDGSLMEPGPRRGVLRGDLGISFITRQPAWTRINERLPNTLILMVPSYLMTLLFALLIGIYSATHQYTFVDNIITGLSFFFYSMPIFFIALMLIYIFGVQFSRWGLKPLPIGGMYDPGQPQTFGNLFMHMIMPVACLVAIQLAGYVRFIRSSMLETMGQDYIRTARSKGMRERRVVRAHALKNAALPLITLIGLDLPFLLAGAVVTESIFAWPGMGRLFIESLERSDYNVMMAILMLLSIAVVVFQLLTDLVYTFFDPRIRYS
ncbi:MAG: ABC transporter permease [Anaerolineae bacterium]|nr:ABC transporter permease [Anaerolineae bacterium]